MTSPWAGSRDRWCFRGLPDDGFELLPSALRAQKPASLGYTHAPMNGIQRTGREQMRAEFERLHEFYWTADAQGLVIPEDGQLLRTPEGWRELKKRLAKRAWPPDNLLSMLALAQHSGVATRLLDWSDRPLIAAYFAASGAAQGFAKKEPRIGPFLSVWALDLDWTVYHAWPSTARGGMRVYVVTAPRATNSNLHAQGGLFTTDPIRVTDFGRPVRSDPVDALVRRKARRSRGPDIMAHITVPAVEAGSVLRRLHSQGISAASVYPGFRGVADTLTERSLWDKRERASYWFW